MNVEKKDITRKVGQLGMESLKPEQRADDEPAKNIYMLIDDQALGARRRQSNRGHDRRGSVGQDQDGWMASW